MRLDDERESRNVEDRRGGGGGGGFPGGPIAGGGIGMVAIALVAMFLGVDPGQLMQAIDGTVVETLQEVVSL